MKRTLGIAIIVALLTLGGFQLSKSRSFQFYGRLVTRVETDQLAVAMTLDDGPSSAWTSTVLGILDSLDVRATLFVTGRELEQNPDEGRRIVEAGNALGNHSYTHRRMVLRSPSFVRQEIERTDRLIRGTGWEGPIPFRPPFGKRLIVLPRYLAQTGRETILWDIEPESFADVVRTPEGIADHVVDNVRPGSIILLHVMYGGGENSRRALPEIVRRLRQKGYRFVAVQELLEMSIQPEHASDVYTPPNMKPSW